MDSDSFSQQLKHETFDWHTKVRTSTFAQDLAKANLSIETYSTYIAALLVVYRALESALEEASASNSAVANINFREKLLRAPSLESDLEAVYGEDYDKLVTVVAQDEVIKKYVKRVQEVAQSKNPIGLVAHAYTRYMGDLSGGQMLRRKIAQGLGFSDEKDNYGVRFYVFDKIEDPKEFKDVFRAGMDAALGDHAENRQLVIDEVRVAYAFNLGLLEWVHSPAAAAISVKAASTTVAPAVQDATQAKVDNGCCVIS